MDTEPSIIPTTNIHDNSLDKLYYSIRNPSDWVFSAALTKYYPSLTPVRVSSPKELPSSTRSAKTNTTKKRPQPCTLRAEITSPTHNHTVKHASHGTSTSMTNLADKDTLIRALERYRCEHLSPRSELLPHDATREDCDDALQRLSSEYVVLKTPLGSRGEGIYFCERGDVAMVYEIVSDHLRRASLEKDFMTFLKDYKGRIPSWVLQNEIRSYLIRDKKFHLRSYVAVTEDDFGNSICVYVYNKCEVRIASEVMEANSASRTNRFAHITNGACSDNTERCLLSDIPELVDVDMQIKVDQFMAQMFGVDMMDELKSEVEKGIVIDNMTSNKFAFAGVDIMMDSDGNLFLLEVNVNPAAPPEDVINTSFRDHLVALMGDLLSLALWKDGGGFILVDDILSGQEG